MNNFFSTGVVTNADGKLQQHQYEPDKTHEGREHDVSIQGQEPWVIVISSCVQKVVKLSEKHCGSQASYNGVIFKSPAEIVADEIWEMRTLQPIVHHIWRIDAKAKSACYV